MPRPSLRPLDTVRRALLWDVQSFDPERRTAMADVTVKDIFKEMPNRFNADAAKGMDAVIQFNLSGDDGGQYYAVIKDGKLEVKEGTHPSPKMTMTMAGKDYVDLTLGKLNGQMAFMQGKLKIAGDMGLAMKMQTLFKNA